jgi:hypothetical protein
MNFARKIALALGAIVASAIAFAGPALAGTPPTGANLPTTVTVSQPVISLSMSTSSLAITVTPGQTAQTPPNAVSYSITSTDSQGYIATISAPNLTSGPNTLAAQSMTDAWAVAPGSSGASLSGSTILGNGPTTTYASGAKMSGNGAGTPDAFSEQWSVTAPGNQAPGSYSTTISYVAVAQ